MRHIIARDLLVGVRSPGFWTALVLHVLLVGAFVAVWGEGLPIHGARGIGAQATLLNTGILCVLLPWAALRISPPEARLHVAATALTMATSPTLVVVSRVVTQAIALTAIAVGQLPVLLVVQEVAPRPAMEVVGSVLEFSVLAGVSAVVASAASMLTPHRLPAWVCATVVTGLVAVVPGSPGLAVRLIAGVGGAALLARWAGNQLQYANGLRETREAGADAWTRESNTGREVA